MLRRLLVDRIALRVTGGSPSTLGSAISIAGACHVSPLLSVTRLAFVLTLVTRKRFTSPAALVALVEARRGPGGDGGGEVTTTAEAAEAWLDDEVNEAVEEQNEAVSSASLTRGLLLVASFVTPPLPLLLVLPPPLLTRSCFSSSSLIWRIVTISPWQQRHGSGQE